MQIMAKEFFISYAVVQALLFEHRWWDDHIVFIFIIL